MWLVELITVIEYHPYLFLTLALIICAVVRFFRKEHLRPSYKEKMELEQLLRGFERKPDGTARKRTDARKSGQ